MGDGGKGVERGLCSLILPCCAIKHHQLDNGSVHYRFFFAYVGMCVCVCV